MKIVKFTVSLWLISGAMLWAQEKKPEKTQEAFVRIINASTVVLEEPWRSGVDLAFKGQMLATDMRAGRSSGYRKIRFTGKDTVDVFPTGKKDRVGSVPATFEKGKFYSIFLTGTINEAGFQVTPTVGLDYPLPLGKLRKGSASVNLLNAVTTFPVRLRVDEGEVQNLPALETREFYLTSGGHPYRLIFPHQESMQEMQGEMQVAGEMDYTAIVFASPEKPDRAILRFINNSEQIRNALAAEQASKKEGESEPTKNE